jgi:RyR domain
VAPEHEEDAMTPEPTSGEVFPPDVLDRIARAIHERYRRNQARRKTATDPAVQPWGELAETLRESNRHQAGDIGRKVRGLGYRVVSTDGEPTVAQFTPEEIERLAMMEHDRWVAERRASGWTTGAVRDIERKITPHLVPWDQLAEEVREYDRDAVRAIPELMAEAGFEIRRT